MNELFYQVFENIPRQGPGSSKATQKAFSIIKDHLPENPEILDIGCGKGVQTIDLASISGGNLIGLDNHQPFLDALIESAKDNKLDKLRVINADMASLPFNTSSFDLIWAEGSIFIMGMKAGLRAWKSYIKNDGFLVFSDLVWLTNERPKVISQFLESECPNILTIEESLMECEKAGYQIVDHFTLPENGWTEEYYQPQRKIISRFRKEMTDNADANLLFDSLLQEATMYDKYREHFGYEFFILRKA